MVVVCSGDQRLIKLCADIIGKQSEIQQLQDMKQLINLSLTGEDVLIIDLEGWHETDLPDLICPAIVLVSVPVYAQAMRLLPRGVRGYGNRHMLQENLMQVLSSVQTGQVWLPPSLINQMITSLPPSDTTKKEQTFTEPLSKREGEVVAWVVHGLSNKEIADKLFISLRTVKAHLTSIFKKTECRNRLELALKMK